MAGFYNKFSRGQSLIEVIVAMAVMSLLLVALLSLMSLSVKNSRLARDRTRAVAYGQQGVELMRAYRDYHWNQFSHQADGTVYSQQENWTVGPGVNLHSPCVQNNISLYFTRCVTLTDSGADNIAVAVTVAWKEGSQTFQTTQTTNLSLWE